MRVYLQSETLGRAISDALSKLGRTQKSAAEELKISQGQISHLIGGDFKTKNRLVVKVCKYVNIEPDMFLENLPQRQEVDSEALAALGRACRGPKQKTAVVIRVLRALEDLSPAG